MLDSECDLFEIYTKSGCVTEGKGILRLKGIKHHQAMRGRVLPLRLKSQMAVGTTGM